MKRIETLLILSLAVSVFSSCGGGEDGSSLDKSSNYLEETSSSVSVENENSSEEFTAGKAQEALCKIKDENLDALAVYKEDVFTSNCEKLYGISEEKLEDGGILYASSGGLADEISIIKLSDGGSGRSILEERLSVRKNTFANYKPEEMPKLEKSQIFEVEGYWVMVISDNVDEIAKEIKNSIED